MKYIKINQFGVVVGGGECPDQDFPNLPTVPGETLVPNVNPPRLTTIWRYTNNTLVNTNQPLTPPQSYMTWSNSTFSWVDSRTSEQKLNDAWEAVREERNALLAATDYTQLADAPAAVKAAYATYRQQLRDITQQSNPNNVLWPTEPSVQ